MCTHGAFLLGGNEGGGGIDGSISDPSIKLLFLKKEMQATMIK